MAEHIIIVDDDDDYSPCVGSRSQPTCLTQEQKERIAKQKELALARRSALDAQQNNQASPAPSECLSASALLGKLRASKSSLVSNKPPSVTAATASFPRFMRRPFEPPLKVVNLDDDRDNDPQISVLQKRRSQSYDSEEDFAVSQERNVKIRIDNPAKKVHGGSGTGNKINDASAPAEEMDMEAGVGDHAKARYNGTDESRGWVSVRKRSFRGRIFGNVGRDSVSIRLPSYYNANGHNILAKKLTLSPQQRKVLSAIAAGKSVFLTGSAGTGKSYLLQEAVSTLKNMYGADKVYVTASTGLAACAIGGTTLHSFAGIGLGTGDKNDLASKARNKREVRRRWVECMALVVDEISMIDGELFDKLEFVARAVRGTTGKAFGGIQLLVTGDFFQLPPVQPEKADKYFAFQADCWNDCFDLQVELTQVFRQSDLEFVDMLNELRQGHCSPSAEARLKACNRPVMSSSTGILLTKLYPRKMDVNRENEQSLRSLNKETVQIIAKDEGKSDFALRQLENVRAEKVLYLSVGAQVMLVKNVDSSVGLVNGSRGVVVRFISVEELDPADNKDVAKKLSPSGLWPVVLFACDGIERTVKPESWSVLEGNTEVAKRTQIPLILAWALSVHKCQGMTLDRVEIDLSRSFEYGMVYVALSRVRCLDGLRLIGFNPSLIKVHSKVVQFYEQLKASNQSEITS